MKQNITAEQFRQLSEENRNKWYTWALNKGYTSSREVPIEEITFKQKVESLDMFPSIGQMIEFLDEHNNTIFDFQKKNEVNEAFWNVLYIETLIQKTELCDALWESVKEVLEG